MAALRQTRAVAGRRITSQRGRAGGARLGCLRAVPERDLQAEEELERRVETLEARLKAQKGSREPLPSSSAEQAPPPDPAKPLYAQTPTPQEWETLSGTEKLYNIWVREKGVLWYINQSAYYSVFILIGGWIVFRFVGPALGLYQLTDL
mmetsp:Transcript_18638/g.63502  ORF Transcript_18638/g.63502 Transcript_18638/m.63502 type:complete len:149 (+) Transcript_18638:133-579(+)